MYSVYHFFKSLIGQKAQFMTVKKLQDFPYDENLLSYRNKGKFPDMAIKISTGDKAFTGGELIELKDSKSYAVPSFNSVIPVGKKEIAEIIVSGQSNIRKQMEAAGDNIDSLPVRDVFYLIRGVKKGNAKVCLVHGSFFQTIEVEELIKQSFGQVLEETLKDSGEKISEDMKDKILSMFRFQKNFSRVRDIEKASVKLRFRIMTEPKAEVNILNPKKYPDIRDNTLNLLVPCYENQEKEISDRMNKVFGTEYTKLFDISKIRHHFNGEFLVFQIAL